MFPDAAVVDDVTPGVTAAYGDTTLADVAYFSLLSGERAILEVSCHCGIQHVLARDQSWTVPWRCCGRENKINAAIASFRI